MKRISIVSVVIAAITLGFAMSNVFGADDDEKKPAHTIKEVMKVGHKQGLLKKVIAGDASQDEKKKLLDLYISMLEAKPKKGDNTSWQKLAGGSALAAAKVVVGRDGATDELKAATNCKACHSVHK